MFFGGWIPPEHKKAPVPIGAGGSVFEYEFNLPEPEGSIEEKRSFAAALLRTPDDPLGAAIEVFGQQRGSHCFHVSCNWPQRDDVRELMRELVATNGEEFYLPTKAAIARDVYNIAKDKYTTRDISLKAFDQYAKIMDMNPKKETVAGAVVQVGVMLVPSHGSDADWEADMRAQQAKLLIDATANK